MRNRIAFSVIFFAASCLRADDALPKRPDFKNYQAMLKRSPFAIATVAVTGTVPDFAKDLYIANAARTSDGDVVTIASASDKNFKKYLTTKGPVDGYSIASIEWSDRVGATKVTITKDGKYAALTFNQALLTQPPQNSASMQGNIISPQGTIVTQPVPGINPPQNFIKPAPIPSLPPPQPMITPPPLQNRPRVRGVIQRNPNATPAVPNVPQPQIEE